MDMQWLNIEIISVGNFSVTALQLILSITLFIAAIIASKIARRGIDRIAGLRQSTSIAQIYTIKRIVHYLFLLIGFIFAASALGIDLSKLAIMGGALGIGIGLGLQGIVNNFFSGIIIMLDKSLKVGDFIELSDGLVGEVIRINIRSTVIRTNDNVDMLVPNSEFVSSRVTNWTLEESIRRFRVPFSVAYGTDKNIVKKAAIEAANAVSLTLNDDRKAPVVWMTGFGDSSLDFVLAVWVNPEAVKRPSHMMSEYLWAIDDAFRQYDIEIPFPQRDLHLRSGFQKDPEEAEQTS